MHSCAPFPLTDVIKFILLFRIKYYTLFRSIGRIFCFHFLAAVTCLSWFISNSCSPYYSFREIFDTLIYHGNIENDEMREDQERILSTKHTISFIKQRSRLTIYSGYNRRTVENSEHCLTLDGKCRMYFACCTGFMKLAVRTFRNEMNKKRVRRKTTSRQPS